MLAETKAENTVQAMRELEESAAKIGSVINTINDIAGKTDLLALNATIEAASAGEAGKGFAVVANEVKELATQTAHATKEIGQLIQQMQSKTGVAVEATADIGTLIDGLNQMMQSISSSISQQSSATREISRTVEGTSRSAINMSSKIEESSDLSTNVANNIDELGQKSVSVKNDSQASLDQSQALSQMSDDLKHLIHQFKVEA
jgi:methyl-accepting chemotaxis protein